MKKSVMLMMVMMVGTFIFAQSAKDPAKRAEAQTDKMKAALSLNDAQYATIKGINKKYAEKYGELRKDSATKNQKHEVMKSLRQEKEKEINAILTTDQKNKWATYKAERAAKQKEKRAERVAKREARLKTELSLSDDQLSKMQSANNAFNEKRKALIEDSDTRDKKEFKKLKAEHEATIKGILTDEQFQKWSAMKKDMMEKHNRKHK